MATKVKAKKKISSTKAGSKAASAKNSPPPAPTAALQYIPWHTIPLEQLTPLFQRQFVTGEQVMMARVLLKKGCIVPEHSHHNEQLSYVLDGSLKWWIDGREIVVRSGEVLCIPADMAHKVEALEDSVALDVFSPPRADWINRTDQYLRGEK